MTFKDLFTDKEWRTLQCVPWWVFYTVAGADTRIDMKELGSLLSILSCKTATDPLTMEILTFSMEELAEIQSQATAEIGSYWGKLKEVADILEQKTSPSQAKDFKETMLKLAYSIANASGGFLGLGEKVSTGEQSVISDLAFALRAN